jgi:hypothetical protein
MGYTTEFKGQFELTPRLTLGQAKYLEKFSQTKRIKRNPSIAEEVPDLEREVVGLPIGDEAEYFVGGTGEMGQDLDDPSIVDSWYPPSSQPGFWCQWVPTEDRNGLEWNGQEKFKHYIEWLGYIIENFLKPWGIFANGTVTWQGESSDDRGKIIVKDNDISILSIEKY